MSAPAVRPGRRILPWIGLLLLVLAGALATWSAFRLARGPNLCGIDVDGCSGPFVLAVFGAMLAFFVLVPVGFVLGSARVPRAGAIGSALVFGGAAAGVWAARFSADPMTDGTFGTWVAIVLLGVLAAIAVLGALRPPSTGPDREAIARAVGAPAATARVRTPEQQAALRGDR